MKKLRFKDFNEDWKHLKVKDLLLERNVKTPKSEDYPLMSFIAYEGVVPKGKRYNREFLVNDESNKKYKRTEYDDFIYSSNNLETGSIGLNKYGKASISPVYSIFQKTSNSAINFISQMMLRREFINKMIRWRQGVVYGQWRIHESNFIKIEVKVPCIDEQRKIGNFLSSIDKLVGKQKEKVCLLKEIKKSYLHKIFNQELRFKDENEEGYPDWKSETMNDFAEVISGGTPSTENDSYWNGDIFWFTPTEIGINKYIATSKKMITKLGMKKSSAKLVPCNSILLTTRATIGEMSINLTECTTNQGFQSLVTKQGTKVDYLYYLLGTKKKEMIKYSNGSTFIEISHREMIKLPLLKACENEQEKIGDFLSFLDKKIEAQESKFSQYEQLKKGYMQRLFAD